MTRHGDWRGRIDIRRVVPARPAPTRSPTELSTRAKIFAIALGVALCQAWYLLAPPRGPRSIRLPGDSGTTATAPHAADLAGHGGPRVPGRERAGSTTPDGGGAAATPWLPRRRPPVDLAGESGSLFALMVDALPPSAQMDRGPDGRGGKVNWNAVPRTSAGLGVAPDDLPWRTRVAIARQLGTAAWDQRRFEFLGSITAHAGYYVSTYGEQACATATVAASVEWFAEHGRADVDADELARSVQRYARRRRLAVSTAMGLVLGAGDTLPTESRYDTVAVVDGALWLRPRATEDPVADALAAALRRGEQRAQEALR